MRTQGPRQAWHVAMPVGYTWFDIGPGESRAVTERYSGRRGLNLGFVGGVSLSGRHHGVRLDVEFMVRSLWIAHSATLMELPNVAVHEKLRRIDEVIAVSFYYSYRL